MGGMSQHQPTSASQPHPWARPRSPPGLCGSPSPPRHSEHSNQAPADPRGKAKEPPRAKHSPHTHTEGTGSAPLELPFGIPPPGSCSYQELLLAGLRGWVGLEGLQEAKQSLGAVAAAGSGSRGALRCLGFGSEGSDSCVISKSRCAFPRAQCPCFSCLGFLRNHFHQFLAQDCGADCGESKGKVRDHQQKSGSMREGLSPLPPNPESKYNLRLEIFHGYSLLHSQNSNLTPEALLLQRGLCTAPGLLGSASPCLVIQDLILDALSVSSQN